MRSRGDLAQGGRPANGAAEGADFDMVTESAAGARANPWRHGPTEAPLTRPSHPHPGVGPQRVRGMTKDVFEELTDDHDKQRTLIDLVGKTKGDSDGRHELFERLAVELKAHAKAEERIVYSRLLKSREAQDRTVHSIHEHEVMDDLIEDLLRTDRSSPGWKSTFDTLAHKVLHHVEEEEQDTFADGRAVLSDGDAADLGREFRSAKDEELDRVEVSAD